LGVKTIKGFYAESAKKLEPQLQCLFENIKVCSMPIYLETIGGGQLSRDRDIDPTYERLWKPNLAKLAKKQGFKLDLCHSNWVSSGLLGLTETMSCLHNT